MLLCIHLDSQNMRTSKRRKERIARRKKRKQNAILPKLLLRINPEKQKCYLTIPSVRKLTDEQIQIESMWVLYWMLRFFFIVSTKHRSDTS